MSTHPARRLIGKKVLMVIAPENYRDEELDDPREILEREGAEITVACKKMGEVRGMLGTRVMPEITVKEAKSRDFDSVVVVGGTGSPRYLWPDEELHGLLRDANAEGKVVGGICLSGAVLARAGILKNVEATVYKTTESLEEMKRGGARYVTAAVVRSGNIVTASGPEAAAEFGKALVESMLGSPVHEKKA